MNRSRRTRRTDFGVRFAPGTFLRGRSLPVARPRPRCLHGRQFWWGRKLPCAQPRCPESWGDRFLREMVPRTVEPDFGKYIENLGPSDVAIETALFERREWGFEHMRWWEWDQVGGPAPHPPWRLRGITRASDAFRLTEAA